MTKPPLPRIMATMRLPAILCLLSLKGASLFLPLTHAAEAVFSQDSTTLFLIDEQQRPQTLITIDVASGQANYLSVPVGESSAIISIERTSEGAYLLLTEENLFAWHPEDGPPRLLATAGDGDVFADVAFDLATEAIAIVSNTSREDTGTEWNLHHLPLGGSQLFTTSMRRIAHLTAVTFDSAGEFFLSSEGDIWHGGVVDLIPEETPGGSLSAYRYAPLATRETSNATPLQTGVSSLIASGPWLYAHVRRMGGSGWGDVVRLAAPTVSYHMIAEGEFPAGLRDRVETYKRALDTLEELAECGTLAHLAASVDGSLVYFQGSREAADAEHWLIRDHGEPTPFTVTMPD